MNFKKLMNSFFSCLLVCIPLRLLGFSYEQFSFGPFTSLHVLTVDPCEYQIIAVKAREQFGDTVATLARRYGAVAAINGGFWKPNRSPAGALKIHDTWLGTPTKPRGAIGWSNSDKKVLIDRILTNYSLETRPVDEQIEVIPVSSPPYTVAQDWDDLEYIVGGTPVLVRNGIMIEDFRAEQTLISFLEKRHYRTAIGIRENGDWVFVAVNGLFFGLLGGMTIAELAQAMIDLGCIEALNLDGGGSSTMVIENSVINDPSGRRYESGKFVEAVSDAILIIGPNNACEDPTENAQ